LKGELKALSLSDNLHLLKPESTVFLFTPAGIQEKRKIKSLRQHSRYLIISFYDIIDVAAAAKYRNSTVNVKKESLPPLKKGVFFYEQIIGLSVFSSDGLMIGKIEDILETDSNDVYIVKDKDKEYLIPAIKDVIKEIDLRKKRIIIEIIDGLLN
jgi:16S rRNA processing protein RimM